mgnify:CR=1 FL=1
MPTPTRRAVSALRSPSGPLRAMPGTRAQLIDGNTDAVVTRPFHALTPCLSAAPQAPIEAGVVS